MELPTWQSISQKYDEDEELNPLEQFIYLCEPTDHKGAEKEFRDNLKAAIEFAVNENREK